MSTLLDSASLVVTPNGYKTSKLYSIVPSDGTGDFTATRAGDTATRVASDGFIKVNRTNQILQSNNFSSATWTKSNVTITSGQSDPLGGTTAFLMAGNTSTSNAKNITQVVGTFTADPKVWSIYVKPNTHSLIQIAGDSGTNYCNFDLINLTTSAGAGTGLIESIGNGWYRCSYYRGSGLTAFRVILISSMSDTFNPSTTITNSIYIWRSQFEIGNIVTNYIETTTAAVTSGGPLANVPRIDYTGGGCPKLLIEPSRTNLSIYSTMLNFSTGWTAGNLTITSNNELSPCGILDADTLTDSTTSAVGSLDSAAMTITANATYTASVFIKKTTGTLTSYPAFRISLSGVSGKLDTGIINTTTGTIFRDTSSTINAASYSVQDYKNFWRVICTFTDNASNTTARISLVPAFSTNGTSFSNLATGSAVFWGSQLEAGAYATSYIQTFNASVTRNEDLIVDSTATSLIGQTEGTIFLNASLNGTTSFPRNITLSDGTTSNRVIINFGNNGANLIQCELIVGGVAQVSGLQTTIDMTNEFKLAYAYKTNNFRMYLNGTLIATDTSGSTFSGTTLSRVAFTTINGTSQSLDGKVKSFALWKTALSNADLASLTTL